MSDFWPVSTDRANEAYAAALLRCRQHQFSALTRRTVAAVFGGVYCTKALEPKFAALYPDDRVYYYTASYSGDKMLVVSRQTETGATLKAEIRLCRKGEKYVDEAELIKSAEWHEQQIERLETALAAYWDNIQQYNVLCNCLRAAYGRVCPVMYCLDRPGSF